MIPAQMRPPPLAKSETKNPNFFQITGTEDGRRNYIFCLQSVDFPSYLAISTALIMWGSTPLVTTKKYNIK